MKDRDRIAAASRVFRRQRVRPGSGDQAQGSEQPGGQGYQLLLPHLKPGGRVSAVEEGGPWRAGGPCGGGQRRCGELAIDRDRGGVIQRDQVRGNGRSCLRRWPGPEDLQGTVSGGRGGGWRLTRGPGCLQAESGGFLRRPSPGPGHGERIGVGCGRRRRIRPTAGSWCGKRCGPVRQRGGLCGRPGPLSLLPLAVIHLPARIPWGLQGIVAARG